MIVSSVAIAAEAEQRRHACAPPTEAGWRCGREVSRLLLCFLRRLWDAGRDVTDCNMQCLHARLARTYLIGVMTRRGCWLQGSGRAQEQYPRHIACA